MPPKRKKDKKDRCGLTPEQRREFNEELQRLARSFRRRPNRRDPTPSDTSEASSGTSSSKSQAGLQDDDHESDDSQRQRCKRLQGLNIPTPVTASDLDSASESSASDSSHSEVDVTPARSRRGPGRPRVNPRRTSLQQGPGRPPRNPSVTATSRIPWEDITHLVPLDPPLPLGAPQQLPLAGPSRIRRDLPKSLEDGEAGDSDAYTVMEVSVTISAGSRDIDKAVVWPQLHYFVKNRCVAGLISLEKGFQEDHLHCQGVLRLVIQDSASVKGACTSINRELKECLGWQKKDTAPKGFKIKVTALKDCDLHTFEGMLGYCTKDKGLPHYDVIMENVTEDELKRGADLFVRFGAGKLLTLSSPSCCAFEYAACTCFLGIFFTFF